MRKYPDFYTYSISFPHSTKDLETHQKHNTNNKEYNPQTKIEHIKKYGPKTRKILMRLGELPRFRSIYWRLWRYERRRCLWDTRPTFSQNLSTYQRNRSCPCKLESSVMSTKRLKTLIESVNEDWDNSIALTKPRPQPDYTIGCKRTTFTEDQLKKSSRLLVASRKCLSS